MFSAVDVGASAKQSILQTICARVVILTSRSADVFNNGEALPRDPLLCPPLAPALICPYREETWGDTRKMQLAVLNLLG